MLSSRCCQSSRPQHFNFFPAIKRSRNFPLNSEINTGAASITINGDVTQSAVIRWTKIDFQQKRNAWVISANACVSQCSPNNASFNAYRWRNVIVGASLWTSVFGFGFVFCGQDFKCRCSMFLTTPCMVPYVFHWISSVADFEQPLVLEKFLKIGERRFPFNAKKHFVRARLFYWQFFSQIPPNITFSAPLMRKIKFLSKWWVFVCLH